MFRKISLMLVLLSMFFIAGCTDQSPRPVCPQCPVCDTQGAYSDGLAEGIKQGHNDGYKAGYQEGIQDKTNDAKNMLQAVLILTAGLVVIFCIGYFLYIKFGIGQGFSNYFASFVRTIVFWLGVPTVLLGMFLAGLYIAFWSACANSANCAITAQLSFVIGVVLLALTVAAHVGGLLNAPNAPKISLLPIILGLLLGIGFAIAMITIFPSARLFVGIITLSLTSIGLITLYLYFTFGNLRIALALGFMAFILGVFGVFVMSENTATMLATLFPI
jgi:hypothetical protein